MTEPLESICATSSIIILLKNPTILTRRKVSLGHLLMAWHCRLCLNVYFITLLQLSTCPYLPPVIDSIHYITAIEKTTTMSGPYSVQHTYLWY